MVLFPKKKTVRIDNSVVSRIDRKEINKIKIEPLNAISLSKKKNTI